MGIFLASGALSYSVANFAPGGRRSTIASRKSATHGLRKLEHLVQGQWISEPVLWTHWMHRGALTATADCRLCLIDAFTFQSAVTSFDHDDFNPKVYAAGFVEGLNAAKDVSDLTKGIETKSLEKLEGYMERLGRVRNPQALSAFINAHQKNANNSRRSSVASMW